MNKEHKENWRDEFDKRFVRDDGLIDKYTHNEHLEPECMAEAIKSFISQLLAKNNPRCQSCGAKVEEARLAGQKEAMTFALERTESYHKEVRALGNGRQFFTMLEKDLKMYIESVE